AAVPRTLPLHLCRFRHWRVLHAGDCWNCWIDFAVQFARPVVRTRRHIFVWSLPDTPAVRDLAGTSYSRSADLGVLVDLHPHPRCAECVGHAVGKRNKRPGQQARVAEKTRARLDSFVSLRPELLPEHMDSRPSLAWLSI